MGTACTPGRGVSERGVYLGHTMFLICYHINGGLMVRSPGCNGNGPSFESRASRNRNFELIEIIKFYNDNCIRIVVVPRCGSNCAHQGESSDAPFFLNFIKKKSWA